MTIAEDVISLLVIALDDVEVDWARVATDGEPSVAGKKASIVTKLKEKERTRKWG